MQKKTEQPKPKSKKQFVWGIICLLAPTVLIIIVIVGYAVANFLASKMSTVGPLGTGPLAELAVIEPSWKVPVNVGLFTLGALAVAAWLPSLIGGIILLTYRK